MNLFIDTNVFLSFYHFSSDDLEELKKLAVLLREEEVKLFLPEQVVHEFQRNRANKIADALKRLRKQSLSLQFPQISKDYDEYSRLRAAQREYSTQHAALVEKIEQDVLTENLKADEIIQELFALAESISTTADLLECARTRMDIGNPPGKKDSLGDAINWEALLQQVPDSEDLYFITDDGDYYSPLDNDLFAPFLLREWKETKGASLISYKRLSELFRDAFPNIKLASELEKDLLIQQLAISLKFAQTHRIIARLSQYSEFTPIQVNDIVEAAITNNQVYWIVEDQDVEEFLTSVIDGRENQIDPDNLKELKHLLGETEDEEYLEIPF